MAVSPMDETIAQVQGRNATKPEFCIALALDKMDIPYEFQYPIYGGLNVRGVIVVDFVCYTPLRRALEYFGKYWHSGALGADDWFKLALEQQYFKSPTIVIYDGEAETVEDAEAVIRERLL